LASRYPRTRPSFPTRRSSDLDRLAGRGGGDRRGRVTPSADDVAQVAAALGDPAAVELAEQRDRVLAGGAEHLLGAGRRQRALPRDRKSTRLNSSHVKSSYAVF